MIQKVLLIIPAYNEAENIKKVISELHQNACADYDYLIINDGSKDETGEICSKEKYHYVNMPVNVGLAGVFRTGMKYADRNNYDMVLQYDGDGQHDPRYIARMVHHMSLHNTDIVIGSRYVKTPPGITPRALGSYLIRFLIFITTGKKITDPTSGMRLYNKRMIHLLSNNINMPPEPDTLAYLLRCGCKIEEVEVQMRERQAGISYLNIGNSVRYMFNICISIIFVQWFRKKEF